MSAFSFQPFAQPFPRWMGPYSPSRGQYYGYRFHNLRLGTWVTSSDEREFWVLKDNESAREISRLVRAKWGGGRVLLLPNGYVAKPLQELDEVGERVLIGRFMGSIVLLKPGHVEFDLSKPGTLKPGDHWPGPATTGLECAMQSDGSLICGWYHPASYGREEISAVLLRANRELARGFHVARSRDASGRVRITANGHVITNRQERNRTWVSIYVGWIDPASWPDWGNWIMKEHV